MLHGGESSSLFRHITELTGEIEGQSRLIAKEEEIGKRLNESFLKKCQEYDAILAKNKELEETVKQNQLVYESQKQVLQRLHHNAALLREQIDSKKEELKKKEDDAQLIKQKCQEMLHFHKQKFKSYMSYYEKLPGVSEHIAAKKRVKELEIQFKSITERVNNIKEIKILESSNKSESVASQSFSTLNDWGVALAQKYMDYRKHQDEKEQLSANIKQRQANIDDLKEKLKKIEHAAELTTLKEVQNCHVSESSDIHTTRDNNATMELDYAIKKKTSLNDFHSMAKSPLQLSVPNLRSEPTGKSFKKYMPSFTFGKSSFLTRSKSMSSLSKGSSGSGVQQSKIPALTSLKTWLSTGNRQMNIVPFQEPEIQAVTKNEEMPLPNSTKNSNSMQWMSEVKNHAAASRNVTEMTVPDTPPQTAISPTTPQKGFNFNDVCMSPDDDFRFSPHMLTDTPLKSDLTELPSTSPLDTSQDDIFSSKKTFRISASNDQDFKFAVPSAPPPGRSVRRGQYKTEENHSKLFSCEKKIFSSPYPSREGNEDFACESSNVPFRFMSGEEEADGRGFSLFGKDIESNTEEKQHGSFLMFKDDEDKPSAFESLFSLGYSNK